VLGFELKLLTLREVELLRLYSNRQLGRNGLLDVRISALSEHRPPAKAVPRLAMTRLDDVAILDLIDRYHSGAQIKDLAKRFGVHRTTVTALLHRHGVERRRLGLSPDQADDARRLYGDGWSLARLGDKFGVDDMTVRRYLLLAGSVMRSPHAR